MRSKFVSFYRSARTFYYQFVVFFFGNRNSKVVFTLTDLCSVMFSEIASFQKIIGY